MNSKVPMYQAIYVSMRDEIDRGVLKTGDRVSSELEVCAKFGVSRITAKKALEMLVADNVIIRLPGKGSFVGQNPPTEVVPRPRPTSGILGVILPDFSPGFATNLLRGVIRRATELGYAATVVCTYGSQENEDKAIADLVAKGVEGIIIMPIHGEFFSKNMLKMVLDNYPLVTLDRYLKGFPAPVVGSDNVGAARKAVRYFVSRGHQKIGLVSPLPKETTTIEERFQGYLAGLQESGCESDPRFVLRTLTSTLPGSDTAANKEADAERIREFLLGAPELTAVLTVEYPIALAVARVARSMGLRVPEDLELLAFDGPENIEEMTGIGQLLQQEDLIGVKSVEILMRLIGGEKTTERVFLDVTLVPLSAEVATR